MSRINDMGYVEADTLLDAFRNPYNVWKGEVIEAMARELIARRKKDEWISVNDRLPDKAMWCLVWDGLDVEKEYFYDDHFAFGDITHWMPLPEPPESEK